MELFAKYFEDNRGILDRIDDWKTITGLSTGELEAMQIWEAVELVKNELIKDIKNGSNLSHKEFIELVKQKNILKKIPATKHPKMFITPKDKVSNLAFTGKISEEIISLENGRARQ